MLPGAVRLGCVFETRVRDGKQGKDIIKMHTQAEARQDSILQK